MTKRLTVLLAVLLLAGLAACGGGGSDTPKPSATERLAAAKKYLDASDAVTIDLATEALPKGAEGVLKASGLGTKAPAFEGEISVIQSGLSVKVPVVAVDGEVSIKFGGFWRTVDPSDFGAPDPADLFEKDGGLSSLLTGVKGAEKGKDTRDGKKVLSTVTGEVPGEKVKAVIPSASDDEDFDATFTLDDEDHLLKATIRGPFYPDTDDVTYTIGFSKYGESEKISKP